VLGHSQLPNGSLLPGVANKEADFESRIDRHKIEWSLKHSIFCDITKRFGSCDIDLFASRVNAKLDRCLLETWPRSMGGWCVQPWLVAVYILLLPTFQPDSPGSTEDGVFGGRLCDGRTIVDDAGLVQQNDETSRRYATPAPQNNRSAPAPSHRRTASFGEKTSTDCLPLVREAIQAQGLPAETTDIIMAAWREGTKRCYRSYIKKWIIFCGQRNRSPFQPTAKELLIFLTSLFREGKGYSSLNVARSAVATLSLEEKCTVGSHPLVCKFLRGVFNRRPIIPKSSVTWDTDVALNFLRKWSPAKCLSLSQWTTKVVLLCLLVTGQRGQSIWLMHLQNMTWNMKDVQCSLGDLVKTSMPGKHQTELVLGHFLQIGDCV